MSEVELPRNSEFDEMRPEDRWWRGSTEHRTRELYMKDQAQRARTPIQIHRDVIVCEEDSDMDDA